MLLELEVLDLSFNALIGGLEGNIGHLEKKSENLRAVDLCTCVSLYEFDLVSFENSESFFRSINQMWYDSSCFCSVTVMQCLTNQNYSRFIHGKIIIF
jgi:hypothetical protein